MSLIGINKYPWTTIFSDDNCSLLNKKSVLQTKYRPLFIKKQTKYRPVFLKIQTIIWKCHSEESKAENRGTMSNTIAQSLLGIITVDSNTIYTMESTHTKINLNDGKLEISWGKSKNTDFLDKYRPITDHF